MLDQGNRTFIGSVVFVDIVGYSKQTVSEQISIKDRFTRLLSEVLNDIPPEQRLILDTGDGAALSFLGDPEDALFVSMNMRDLVAKAAVDAGVPLDEHDTGLTTADRLPLRIGINLGPVKLVRDINGHPNIVGDGINVAQRIMSFARPGQIVVSRSFFDVVSVISEEYAKLFKYEGSRTDKHVREHEIYVVGDSDAAFEKARAGTVDRAAATNPRARAAGVSTGTFGIRQNDSATGASASFFQDSRKVMMAGGVLGAVVLALALALMMKKPAEKASEPATIAKSAVSPDTVKVEPATATPPSDGTKPADTTMPATAEPPASGRPATASSAPSALPAADAKATNAAVAKADASKQVLSLGTVKFNIDPWGNVLINGKSIGVSPPIKQTKLPPGKYAIEVQNTSFKPFVTNVEIKAKEDVSIKHKFQ